MEQNGKTITVGDYVRIHSCSEQINGATGRIIEIQHPNHIVIKIQEGFKIVLSDRDLVLYASLELVKKG